jgi:hypothetical protein
MRVQNPNNIFPISTYFKRSGRDHSNTYNGSIILVDGVPNVFTAVPYIPSKLEIPDSIRMDIAVGVAGFARIGIYQDDGTIWPGSRLFGSGAIVTDIAVFVTEAIAGITLIPGNVYWIASLFSANPTMRGISNEDILSCLGSDHTGLGNTMIVTEALAYGALPATAPKTPTFGLVHAPCITLHLP